MGGDLDNILKNTFLSGALHSPSEDKFSVSLQTGVLHNRPNHRCLESSAISASLLRSAQYSSQLYFWS